MTTYDLRPISTGEILDGALVLLRRNFGLLIGIAIVCQAIPIALGVYIDLTGGAFQHEGLDMLDRLLMLIGGVFVTGATVRVVSAAYLGGAPSLGDALRFAAGRGGAIFGSSIISSVLTILAALALVVPGIIVACGYSVSGIVASLEPVSGSEAVRRSWALTKGFKGKACVLAVVSIALLLVLYLVVGMLGGFAGGFLGGLEPLVSVLAACVSLLIYPVLCCVFTLFYYDLRVRKEGFDIEALSRQLTGATEGGQ